MPLQSQGWQRYHKRFVDTNTEPGSHHPCCSHVDNNDNESRILLARRETVFGRLRPLFSSTSSPSPSSYSAFMDHFQNILQKTVVFLQQTTASGLSSNNKNGSPRQPIRIVREDGHAEYLPIPPHSMPPSYLLQELKWYDRSMNQLDYGGEVRLGQAGLPRSSVWFRKQKQREQKEQSEQQQQEEMVQVQQSSQLHQTTEEVAVLLEQSEQQREQQQEMVQVQQSSRIQQTTDEAVVLQEQSEQQRQQQQEMVQVQQSAQLQQTTDEAVAVKEQSEQQQEQQQEMVQIQQSSQLQTTDEAGSWGKSLFFATPVHCFDSA